MIFEIHPSNDISVLWLRMTAPRKRHWTSKFYDYPDVVGTILREGGNMGLELNRRKRSCMRA
jgi:hypothetical protein